MRQSFIVKALFLVLITSCSQVVLAQSTTKTTSKTKQSRTVEIDKSRNEQLSLLDNDSRFNLSLRFKKERTADVREMLTKELGNTSSKTVKKQIWASKNGAYTFELKEGYVYVNIIKSQLGESEFETLKNVGTATLELVGFHVDVEGSDGHFNIHID